MKEINKDNTNIIETLADIFVIILDLGTDLVANKIKHYDLKRRLKL